MEGIVKHIFTASEAGQQMVRRRSVEITAGHGINGDRYAEGKGAFSHSGNKIRQISLIDLDALIVANLNTGTDFTPAETRRNIVTVGVELNDLIDQEFTVGTIRMIGRSLCDPCARPAKLANKDQDFARAFEQSGGLRAEVLSSGILAVGAAVIVQ